MEGASDPGSLSYRENKNLKILVAVLLVLLIILASVAAFLYIQLRQSNNNSYAQPRFVQLLKPQQVSTAMIVSNCSMIGVQQSLYPNLSFYNASNPTGLQESEVISCASDPFLVVFVLINGFNSSSNSEFAYQNYQLGSSLYNFTASGSIASSQDYSIFGTCNASNYCLVLTGLAISSLYVVRITVIVGTVGQIPSVLNASMVSVMLGMQLSAIQSG